MKPNVLRFFNELDASELAGTFTTKVLEQLQALGAGVTMGLRDHSAQRAAHLRRLNQAGIPAGAWVLLPRANGYFATHDNFTVVEQAVEATIEWAAREHLQLEAIGLDFEPHLVELQSFMHQPLPMAGRWAWRARTAHRRLEQALLAYRRIIERIHASGLRAECYQFPLLLADREADGTLWQRIAGGLDLQADREVTMAYSSLLGVPGAGFVEQLAPRCRALGLGSTGGGIDPMPKLSWEELERDLLLAAAHCTDVTIFSLEGCVQHGFMNRLISFDWNRSTRASLRARMTSQLISTACFGLSRLGRSCCAAPSRSHSTA